VNVLDIPTPALVVDVPALERNIARMARFFAEGPCRLRPHFKAHKTLEIARRQLAAGSVRGLTCATVSEAEIAAPLVAASRGDAASCDLLIANEVVGPGKCDRVAAVARTCPVTIAIDSAAGAGLMADAARRAGVTVGVLIDLDVGQNRCGVSSADEALALARLVTAAAGLELRGVMGYEGHLQPVADRHEREARTRDAMRPLVETAALLREHGLRCDVVSAGGTGTHDISGRVPGVTEIQAGSYALMDGDYARLELPFEQALFVLGTIVSRPAPDRCVADCGHKAATKDHGHPDVHGIAGAAVVSLNDEHATIAVRADTRVVIGDRVRLRPSHIDPTINLHDVLYAVDGDRVIGVWPVAARGYPEHRR
jgi:D-serine deaminase-like pyridoxal phosphate-dependent protein